MDSQRVLTPIHLASKSLSLDGFDGEFEPNPEKDTEKDEKPSHFIS